MTPTGHGGGQVKAARRPLQGADRVARFFLGIASRSAPGQRLVALSVNNGPALALLDGDQVVAVALLTLHDKRIGRVDLVLAPDKLAWTHPAAATGQELP